jgi:hypothetical protein
MLCSTKEVRIRIYRTPSFPATIASEKVRRWHRFRCYMSNLIVWNEFKMAFHSHHVPQGDIKLKKKEFQDLKQGSMTVSEYVTHFTQLSHYAPNDVDTDEKKQKCFLNRLDDGLAYALEARDFKNFQTTVDKALVLENRRGILANKHKQERQSQ